MWEMWAALIAALGLAFALARHDPEKFRPFAGGLLFVLWPIVGGLFAWEFALAFAQLELKAALEPGAFAKAQTAIRSVELASGASSAALAGVIGLHVIRLFVGSKK